MSIRYYDSFSIEFSWVFTFSDQTAAGSESEGTKDKMIRLHNWNNSY